MSAAIAQGVMATTLDVDVWIDLPPRQYVRVQAIAQKLGASIAANTVVFLEDGTPVNFVYEVHGLGPFSRERRRFTRARIHGRELPVLRLEQILKSKRAILRDKDKLHIRLIQEFLRCKRAASSLQGTRATRRSAPKPRRRS
jgi:hypothetical protein